MAASAFATLGRTASPSLPSAATAAPHVGGILERGDDVLDVSGVARAHGGQPVGAHGRLRIAEQGGERRAVDPGRHCQALGGDPPVGDASRGRQPGDVRLEQRGGARIAVAGEARERGHAHIGARIARQPRQLGLSGR